MTQREAPRPDADAPHVFVSYASEDREAARRISEALLRRGYAVWWDRLIAGGTLWGEEIERAIGKSWAVIVLWSDSSVRSDYVRAEARSAAERHILIPAFIGACDPPMPFGEYQTLDLTTWNETSPDALDVVTEALERLRRPMTSEPARPPARPPEHQGASGAGALVRYWTELFQLATGPKTYLLAKWLEADRVSDAARFYVATAVLKLVVGLPLSLKLGGGVGQEILATAVYGSIRMLALGAVVHLAWRLVGGTAGATTTLSGFAYVYSLQTLVFECTQGFAVGLLRLAAPSTADTIVREVTAGRAAEALQRVVSEQGLMMSGGFIALAWWPLFAVPFACWGAFRIHHGVSRARSAIALALSAVLGLIAYGVSVFLSYVNAGPG
jgi:TIR domain-containing protein